MHRFLFTKNEVHQKDAISGVMSGLGALTVEIVYIVFMVLLGINLFRRGAYYELFQRAGEENRISRQAANVIGSLIFFVLTVLLLPVIQIIGKKLFGG